MDIKNVFKDAKNLTDYQLEQRLDLMVHEHPGFRHLNESNKDLILGLVHKYKEKIRQGTGVSAYTIREDGYHLYENRLKLNLTLRDLEVVKEILNNFKTE